MRSFGQAALVCWTRWRLNWSSPPIPGYITISHWLTTRCHNLLVQPDGEEHPLARSAFRLGPPRWGW